MVRCVMKNSIIEIAITFNIFWHFSFFCGKQFRGRAFKVSHLLRSCSSKCQSAVGCKSVVCCKQRLLDHRWGLVEDHRWLMIYNRRPMHDDRSLMIHEGRPMNHNRSPMYDDVGPMIDLGWRMIDYWWALY